MSKKGHLHVKNEVCYSVLPFVQFNVYLWAPSQLPIRPLVTENVGTYDVVERLL